MAVVNLTLIVNISRGYIQASTSNGTRVAAPSFTVGDQYPVRIAFVEQNGEGPAATFSVLSPSSLGLKVGIGTRGGTPAVLQTTWTPSGNYLTGTLDCATAAFSSAVSAGTRLYFEVEVSESGQPNTVYQVEATTRDQVCPTSATTPAPAEEFYTKTEANNTFAKKVGAAGDAITLTSADGTKQVILYVDNDGTFHADAV